MKITITGSLGNISKPLTKELVQKGHKVTVITSKPEKQKDIEALGATAAIGSIEDIKFLTTAFTGADAVYTMIPPVSYFNNITDLMEHCRLLANNYAQAIEQSGVKRVVHLSSVGAHLEKNSGLILYHHTVETILNNLTDIAITFMRPVTFYYNLYGFEDVIKRTGYIISNYGGDDKVAWVSPIDIAAAIAEEIVTPLKGRKVLYAASDELTCKEVAIILGAAIGKPDLEWVIISNEHMQKSLEGNGMPAHFAAAYVEMNASIHSGALAEDYYLHKPAVMGKVKMTDFANEFAEVFLKGTTWEFQK